MKMKGGTTPYPARDPLSTPTGVVIPIRIAELTGNYDG